MDEDTGLLPLKEKQQDSAFSDPELLLSENGEESLAADMDASGRKEAGPQGPEPGFVTAEEPLPEELPLKEPLPEEPLSDGFEPEDESGSDFSSGAFLSEPLPLEAVQDEAFPAQARDEEEEPLFPEPAWAAAGYKDDAPLGECPVTAGEDEPDAAPDPAPAIPAARLLGICLRKAGQVHFFPDARHTVRVGTKVVVEFEQGLYLGEVASIFHNPGQLPVAQDFAGSVLGLATAQDIAQHAENSILSAEASAFCKTCIRQRELDMKLVDVEVLHDRSKIIFFFTAPSRIDFRELVKDLVRNYRTRIELRQIGVRHETQMIGGLGNCGMVCCCHQYLRKFAPVTIKMAKEQNLFLNPAKLSGMCGRLLCCLSFEQSNYEEFNRRCPKLGKKYVTGKGTMKVLRANLFTRSIVALSEAGEEVEMPLEEWDGLEPKRAEPLAPDQQRQEGGRRSGPRREDGPRTDEHSQAHSEGEEGHARSGEPKARPHRPRKRRREQ